MHEIEVSEWSNVGGCSIKHPFNKGKQQSCETLWKERKGINRAEQQAQQDAQLAQALIDQSRRPQTPTAWTPTKTFLVAGGALVVVGILAVVIMKVKKKK